MDKIIFRSESDRENAKASDTEAIWYTVVNELKQSEQMASTNPWNQDESIKFSSHKIYSWEQVIECASWFKGVSFLAAQRIWKVKKL
ncbi:hypothetical protein PCU69_003399 [Escherichia coli]|nr:hypothetical protein [Escherichia coli]EJQ4198091.1 hypothetical protein [Escherichia coli]EKI4732962.1 hypothetical protein [Escherichia coli]ELK8911586.1 hypothetical protein [Escherichia coli]